MPTVAFDIADPQAVVHELDEANRRLARERTVPAAVEGLVLDVAAAVLETSREDRLAAGVDPDAWIDVQQAAGRAQAVVFREHDARRKRRELRLLLEELRFRFARLAEQERLSDERPIEEVVAWFDAALGLSQPAKAALLGVGERTYQRWVSSSAARPIGDDERRLRIVAWLIADLRHVLTAVGAAGWLWRPHPALGGHTPNDIIMVGHPEELKTLYRIAAEARSGAAA